MRTLMEEKRWSQLSYQYMTEESEARDGAKVNKHPLEWRSESFFVCVVIFSPNAELNKLVAVLDDQAKKSAAKNSLTERSQIRNHLPLFNHKLMH